MDILSEQLKCQKQGTAYTVATIIKTNGATPRNVGSKMLVLEDGTIFGTIGGGVLEKEVIEDSLNILTGGSSTIKNYQNKTENGFSPCGGSIDVFIEKVNQKPNLIICGAGHVGGALAELASKMGFNITVIDTRDTETTHENAKYAHRLILVKNFSEDLEKLSLPEKAYCLVSTYGHEEDYQALSVILKKENMYVGMMGSNVKIKSIMSKLLEKGFTKEQLDLINTPVGLDIGGETPYEIALSILAEIQMVRYDAKGGSLKKCL